VAQIRYGDGSDAPATEVITVADLLSRNAPAPVREVEVEPDTGGISVGALLRREGRAPHTPHSADRPLQLRPQQPAATGGDGGTDRRVLVRRGAIAAGTLLAAGSVLGAAMLTEVGPTASQTPATGGPEDDGPYAGQGLLDPEGPAATPPDSVVIDQAAARDPLDPGAPAPSDWVPVAFPGALAGENSGTGATDGGDPGNGGSSSSSGDDGSPAAAAAGDDDDESAKTSSGDSGSSSTSDGGSGSGDSSGESNDDSNNGDSNDGDDDDDGGVLNNVGKAVGGVVNGVGSALGLGGDDGDSDSEKSSSTGDGDDDEDSKSSRSMSLLSADDGDEEDSSAPQDEDDSESGSDAKSSDSSDSEGSDSDSDSGDSDDDGDGGLVGGLLGTVGGLVG
jgi:hypothetical protein